MTAFVYILSNEWHTTLYTGVTTHLEQRLSQHRTQHFKGAFSSRYKLSKLLWYKAFGNIESAILEEKRIKAGSRKAKEKLINTFNPAWADLALSNYKPPRVGESSLRGGTILPKST